MSMVTEDSSWENGPDAYAVARLNVMDRISFHMDLTVRELRAIAAHLGVRTRARASRDEVALVMRREGIAAPTDTGPGERLVTVWDPELVASAKRLARLPAGPGALSR